MKHESLLKILTKIKSLSLEVKVSNIKLMGDIGRDLEPYAEGNIMCNTMGNERSKKRNQNMFTQSVKMNKNLLTKALLKTRDLQKKRTCRFRI